MEALVEHESPKAARILAVAGELVLKRGAKGVSIAEIAEKAHVGKGTIYLYWATKEDLVLGLCARDFLAEIDGFIVAFTEDPGVVVPRRFCAMLQQSARDHHFIRAIQYGDTDLLGVLTEHPNAQDLLSRFGYGAMLRVVLPVWRAHGMARTDWSVQDQAYALQAVLAGFVELDGAANPSDVSSPEVLAATVDALLGSSSAEQHDVEAVAAEGLRLLDEARTAVLATIASTRARQGQQ
ncbi:MULTISPECIES: TetR/AcrR family transcriptional regulator [Lentzea]|uniref:Transcriptional regulator, TetR family n=1 Tax=Lentzea albida TaxID=65499 RepID=A0A1H9U733_9PSEU|nr:MULTISPECIES: TetR/AcrR family transcriptional regulator [Lentzea]USX48721.1 TetR/AcrR family transcriptional regulator [Lentzea sp. HUAS12]SES05390.1 transcriptional regulator, TetR family [Lentzea albida]